MKVYVLCPEWNRKPKQEIFVPGYGYVYFGKEPKIYDAIYVRHRGKHPIEGFSIKDSKEYIEIELDEAGEAAVLNLIEILKRRDKKP